MQQGPSTLPIALEEEKPIIVRIIFDDANGHERFWTGIPFQISVLDEDVLAERLRISRRSEVSLKFLMSQKQRRPLRHGAGH